MFKRFTYLLFLTASIIALSPHKPCFAAELESDIRSKTVKLNYALSLPGSLGSTTTLVISLSSVTVGTNGSLVTISSQTAWPHIDTGHVNITGIRCFVDKLPLSSATIKLGVVTAVNTSSGNVKNFYSFVRSSSSVSDNYESIWLSDEQMINLRVVPGVRTSANSYSEPDGMTPYLISNDLITASAFVQSDVLLNSPSAVGSNLPKVGDIVMTVNKDFINPIIVYLEIQYHTDID